ncbi:MAG: glycosyltransferase, partial [Desulfobacterales bacterium]
MLVVRHPVGGIRTFMRYVYRNFDPKDWKFTIIAPDLAQMKFLLEDLSMHDIKWVQVSDTASTLEISRIVFAQLRGGKYALVHSHGFTSGMCAALPAFAMRTPHLMTSHDVINKNQFSGIKGRLKRNGMAILFS